MSYRDDLDALTARHDALSTEVAQKTKELESATQMLDEAKRRLRLPVLDNIRVATPCSAAWADMKGSDVVRHCGSCDKDVFNLSGMTREEAELLILAKNGNLCVRYYQRKDGTILLKDCVVGVSNRRKRKLIAAGAAALLAGGAAAAIGMKLTAADEAEVEVLMGEPPVEHLGGVTKQEVHVVEGELDREELRGRLRVDEPTK
jgi:hypothetical protein